jgi:diacylglycerol kinase (ATP)
MRVLFVMNPTSGRTSNQEALDYIREAAQQRNTHYKIFFTTGVHDDTKIAEEVANYKPDRIAACGGDGTVQLVARNIIHKKIPMAIVPLGSANGLATALELPKNFREAVDLLLSTHQSIPLDLLKINDQYLCTHLSDIGTNALLVKNYEEAGDKGMLGYAKHLISSIQQSDLMKYEIITDDGTYSKEGYMLMIANAHKYGTGVQISEGSVSDGKFEICNVQKIDLESAIKAGLTALNVFVDKDMYSDVITCTKALIRVQPQAHLQIDGEYIGEVNEIKVAILSAAINVLVTPS